MSMAVSGWSTRTCSGSLRAKGSPRQSVIRDQNVKRGLLSDALSRLESRQKVLDELRNSYEGYSDGTATGAYKFQLRSST